MNKAKNLQKTEKNLQKNNFDLPYLFHGISTNSNKKSKDCYFCNNPQSAYLKETKIFKTDNENSNCLAETLQKSLLCKYSSSQNYFYTRDINDVLNNQRTPVVFKIKEMWNYDDEDEFLKRFYHKYEYGNKLPLLKDYYRFHKDVPRLFMNPCSNFLNDYHDDKRKYEYEKINKILEKEEKYGKGKNINDFVEAKNFEEDKKKIVLDQFFWNKENKRNSCELSSTLKEIHGRLNEKSKKSEIFSEISDCNSFGNLKSFLKYIKTKDKETKKLEINVNIKYSKLINKTY